MKAEELTIKVPLGMCAEVEKFFSCARLLHQSPSNASRSYISKRNDKARTVFSGFFYHPLLTHISRWHHNLGALSTALRIEHPLLIS
jgi:hypothetical protein